MKELLEWIDRVNALRVAPGVRRADLYLAEQLLEDEAANFRNRVLMKAVNILIFEGLLDVHEGVYRVDFTA